MSILNLLSKEKAYAAGDKVKAAMNTDGALRKHKAKSEKFNRGRDGSGRDKPRNKSGPKR